MKVPRTLAVAVALVLLVGLGTLVLRDDDVLGESPSTGSTTSTDRDGVDRTGDDDDAGSTVAPTTPAPATPDATPADPVDTIDWRPCGDAECATLAVPRDHDDPDGPTIDLALLRRPATGDRIGPLFFNFGGPGASTVDLLRSFPVPGDVAERFDLVAVDPRGVGGSTPLGCGVDPRTLYAVDPTVEDEGDADALVAVSEAYARDCQAERGDLLPHVGTREVARDHDLVRAAMGDETLSYIGFSYGTAIGQVYAELFPDRVRAMILDGVVDPAQDGIALAVEQAQGFETALANWAAACPSRRGCALDDPIAAVEAMLARAEDGVASSGGARDLGPGEAAIGLALPLYSQSLWPTLDRAVADALDGDGAGMVSLADRYLTIVDFSIYFAVSCLDSTWPRDVDAFLGAARDAARVAPRFGEAIVNDYLRCAVWPTPPEPLGAIAAPGAPPILVVSTTGDPATPYENGVDVASRLARGALLTYVGEGHTIVFQGSPCVDRVAIDHLLDLVVPPDGDRC